MGKWDFLYPKSTLGAKCAGHILSLKKLGMMCMKVPHQKECMRDGKEEE